MSITSNDEDEFSWGKSVDGKFSTKEAFHWLSVNKQKNLVFNDKIDWTHIWKAECIPRVVLFLWQLLHNKIASLQLLKDRKVVLNDSCPKCSIQQESALHIIRDCPFATHVWNYFKMHTNDFFACNMHDWINSNLKDKKVHRGVPWSTIFAYVCWNLWRYRNELYFNPSATNYLKRPCTIALESLGLAAEYFAGLKGRKNREKVCVFPKWNSPPEGTFKLNCDGACSRNGKGGAGSLIRDHWGNWVIGCARNIGSTTCGLAELWGLRDGLQMALDNNLKPIQVEVDSKATIDLIFKDANHNHAYNAIIRDCRVLLRRLEVEEILHSWREGNAAADELAKIGMGLNVNDPFCNLLRPPISVCNILNLDVRGATTPRLVSFVEQL